MPRAVFIVCSSSRSVDRTTNSLSLFGVLEGYHLSIAPEGTPQTLAADDLASPTAPVFSCTSTWMLDDGDDLDTEYEYQFRVTRPNGKPDVVTEQKFKFTKRFQRFLGTCGLQPQGLENGIMWIENRIRPMGADAWISQSYPIPITVRRIEPTNGQSVEGE